MMTTASRPWLWWIIGLILVSTALFVIGSVIEHSQGEASEAPSTQQAVGESSETGETHPEGEASEQAEVHSETDSGEQVLGFNFENPWLVAAFTLMWLALAGVVIRWPQQSLVPLILIAGVTTALDLREVFFQMGQAHTTIAIVASLVALAHTAVIILAVWTIWTQRRNLITKGNK